MAKIRKNIRGTGQNISDTLHDRLRTMVGAAGNNESRNAALFVEQSGFRNEMLS